MRRKQRARALRDVRFLYASAGFTRPSLAQMRLNKYAFDVAQSFINGAPQPVLPPELDVLWAALEASGMRRVPCAKCGVVGLTRAAGEVICPSCREWERRAN